MGDIKAEPPRCKVEAAADLEDAGAGGLSELEGAHTQLRDLVHADIICDSAHKDGDLAILH